MSAEKVGAGLAVAGELVAKLSPMLAAVPGVGPVLVVIGELVGAGLGIAGSGITLSAQQEASIVAAVRVAIEVAQKVRAETAEAHATRTGDTQEIIDAERAKVEGR
jgi:hypothetical protein